MSSSVSLQPEKIGREGVGSRECVFYRVLYVWNVLGFFVKVKTIVSTASQHLQVKYTAKDKNCSTTVAARLGGDVSTRDAVVRLTRV